MKNQRKLTKIKKALTVLKYSIPLFLKLSAMAGVVITAATGYPLPIGLPTVTISGITSSP